MADYFPLISRAVASLSPGSKEQREAIYARAREALTRQLTSLDPPIPEADLWRERDALEETIRRIEADFMPRVVSTVRPEVPAPDAPAAVKVQPPKPVSAGRVPGAGARVQVATEDEDGQQPPVIVDPSDTSAAPPVTATAAKQGPNVRRPKVSAARGSLTGQRATAAAIFLPVMLALGVLAYIMRDDPAIFERRASEPAATATDAQGQPRKSDGRLDGSSTMPPASVSGPRPAPTAPAPLPVAARAVFFEETTADPRGVQSDGQVVWRLEQVPTSAGRPADVSIRGSATFPGANMGLEFVINRNRDAKLPASHTVELVFRPDGRDGISEIGPIEARDQEAQPGYQLRGAMVPIATNLFLIGLDASEASLERNREALRDQRFFAFQFRIANGKVGALLLEKGPTGDRVFREALDIWSR